VADKIENISRVARGTADDEKLRFTASLSAGEIPNLRSQTQ